jgi:6-phosphofructokinase 2
LRISNLTTQTVLKERKGTQGGKESMSPKYSRHWGFRTGPLVLSEASQARNWRAACSIRGVACDFVEISGETRTNIIVNDRKRGTQTVFSASGPTIEPYELIQIIHKVEKSEKPDMMVISGSLPPGVHPEIYRKMIEIGKSKGARVILDSDGDALKVGIHGAPFAIKPNVHELSRLVGSELNGLSDIIRSARSVHEQGTDIVLVSMGARGIFLVAEKEQFVVSPPKVKVENTIGAGDSAVAGFVYGWTEGKSFKEALVFAVAAGTATTLRPGTALCQKEDFLKLVPKVRVEVAA